MPTAPVRFEKIEHRRCEKRGMKRENPKEKARPA